jgi:hypothetical protein
MKLTQSAHAWLGLKQKVTEKENVMLRKYCYFKSANKTQNARVKVKSEMPLCVARRQMYLDG